MHFIYECFNTLKIFQYFWHFFLAHYTVSISLAFLLFPMSSSLNFILEVFLKYMVMLGCPSVFWSEALKAHSMLYVWDDCWQVGLWVGAMGCDLPVSWKSPRMSVSVVFLSLRWVFFREETVSLSLGREVSADLVAQTGSWAETGWWGSLSVCLLVS